MSNVAGSVNQAMTAHNVGTGKNHGIAAWTTPNRRGAYRALHVDTGDLAPEHQGPPLLADCELLPSAVRRPV